MNNKNEEKEEILFKIGLYIIFVGLPLAFATFLWWPREKIITPQEKKVISEQKKFDSIFSSPRVKKIITKLENNSLNFSKEKFGNIDKKFFCIRINKFNNKIEPFIYLNESFKNRGFNITYSSDSLEYAIICKTLKVDVGNYTNGATAYKLQDNIIIYDIKNDKAFNVKKELGSEPPSQIRSRSNNASDYAVGSSWGDEDFFRESLKFIKK